MLTTKLGHDSRGATAILWALCALPVMVLVAAALDFSDRETAGRHLKSATDSAAIAAARFAIEFDADEAAIKAAAKKNFEENVRSMAGGVGLVPIVTIDEDNGITVFATYDKPTTMLGLAGIPKLKVKARSTAAFQTGSEIEAVLVVDNSFSMNGARMTQLRSAADQFLDEVLEDDSGRVKIGVVPFNNYVNIGTGNAGASWLKLANNYSKNESLCYLNVSDTEAAGCTLAPSCSSDYACTDYVCPTGVNVAYDCTNQMLNFTWYGCVESRPVPLDISDEDYGDAQEVARMNYDPWGCRNEILPLTAKRADIDSHFEALVAEGDTYLATGLSWGIKVLSSAAPFSEGAEEAAFAARGGRKVMIVMSDGENTRSIQDWGTGRDHWGQDINLANARTQAACDYAKDQDIEVYTIAFGVSDSEMIDILEGCASDIEQFYDADNASELMSAFEDIGKAFRDIALIE